jgi:hypothetical protein
MTPGEMLEALDAAIADTPRWRPRKIALELLHTRTVLGERGQIIDDPDEPRYGFTRAQCQRMREHLLAAARADAEDTA